MSAAAPAFAGVALAGAALATVAFAAMIDVRRYEIPDSASAAVLALAVAFGLVTPGFGWWSHLAAVAAMFAFGLLAFARGWLGGGDVKLMTAVAGWTGLAGLPLMFVATSLAGGALALVFVVRRRLAGTTDATRLRLPYAVAILGGTGWWLLATGGGPLAS